MILLHPFSYLLLSLTLVLPALSKDIHRQGSGCRCIYGDPCWPSPSAFEVLALKLSQPLLRPLPPASPCYSSNSSPSDAALCAEARENSDNGTWRSNHPGSMQHPNFESYTFPNGTIESCLLLHSSPGVDFPGSGNCGQGSVPPIGIDARTPSDIAAGIHFANEHHLRLVVKNTGHDFLGRSTARGAFLIWTHHMKDIQVHTDFVPDGAPDGVEGQHGVQWNEAYKAAHEAGRTLVGGITAGGSVGAAGGWVMGGGHSALSPTYGLGVDNVLQFTLLTSSGTHLTANAHTNPDLFWALRGGGGGTFGILTSVTYRTHPSAPLTVVELKMNLTSPEVAQEMVTDQVFPTYLQFVYISPGKSLSEANETFNSILSLAQERSNHTAETTTQVYPSFYAWFEERFGGERSTGNVGRMAELSSRLLARSVVEKDPGLVARLLLSMPNPSGAPWATVAGGAVAQPDPDSAGLNPAWREAVAEVYFGEFWNENENDVETIERARERLINGTNILDPVSVNSAAYFNEAMLYEKDFKTTFFGSHYDRLKEIKNRVDPEALFLVPLGVGSEDWDEDLLCPKGV
ncbi:FAD/FMN-containing protein [Coprinopsis cinerea okayama7|uniref:FAD/FMN-containing protein n=1 Tax=Coprinopsis cinerea (strain Okayama-7 / 130 / ATCC MYA-4618 / FGSC 9003) TaxID=240176 RepID=A8PFJ9_COPC7|nr:FAD/FMN-containing protein [Coprinopsis cinerea okayama7\|eukprot:XP_001841079.2 FAD/FMN-containing protein [Coprinopsis cinerea okayama7\